MPIRHLRSPSGRPGVPSPPDSGRSAPSCPGNPVRAAFGGARRRSGTKILPQLSLPESRPAGGANGCRKLGLSCGPPATRTHRPGDTAPGPLFGQNRPKIARRQYTPALAAVNGDRSMARHWAEARSAVLPGSIARRFHASVSEGLITATRQGCARARPCRLGVDAFGGAVCSTPERRMSAARPGVDGGRSPRVAPL